MRNNSSSRPPDSSNPKAGWRLQRLAWVFATLFLLASAVGLLGQGPLAHRSKTAGTTHIRLANVSHMSTEQEWLIHHTFNESLADKGRFSIWIDRSVLQDFELLRSVPAPVETGCTDRALRFTYIREASTRSAAVQLILRPETCGIKPIHVRVNDDIFSTHQLVLP